LHARAISSSTVAWNLTGSGCWIGLGPHHETSQDVVSIQHLQVAILFKLSHVDTARFQLLCDHGPVIGCGDHDGRQSLLEPSSKEFGDRPSQGPFVVIEFHRVWILGRSA